MLNAFKRFFVAHKFITTFIAIALIAGGTFAYKKANTAKAETRYVLAAVEKSTLVKSVSGSGQISSSSQVDVKPEASGKLISVSVVKGQKVKSGQLLAQIEATEALKSLRDAESNLKNAELSMSKLKAPPEAVDLLQAEDALRTAKDSETQAKEDLARAYEEGFNAVAEAFLDLPDVMTDLDSILYDSEVSNSQWNVDAYADIARRYDPLSTDLYRDAATQAYLDARAAHEAAFDLYKTVNRSSDEEAIDRLINETYAAIKRVGDAAKAETDFIQYYQDQVTQHQGRVSSYASTHLSQLAGHTGSLNSHASGLLNARRSIQNSKDAVVDATHTIVVKQAALENLNAGTDELDLASQELTLQQRRDAVMDAKIKLGDYSVRAPFDGVVADVAAVKGDNASTGSAVATIITEQQVAEITLNEVDIAKIAVGQKATLTFDSLADFSLTGTVADVDTLGTVNQGVVTYGVKIALDVQDERIKPGMSVSASIVTDAKTDALIVPSAAIKTQGGVTYIETIDGADAAQVTSAAGIASQTAPRRIEVETGLENDTQTEILSGLAENDLIITRTITASSQAASSTQNRNILQAAGASGTRGGGGFTGGNAIRIQAQ